MFSTMLLLCYVLKIAWDLLLLNVSGIYILTFDFYSDQQGCSQLLY